MKSPRLPPSTGPRDPKLPRTAKEAYEMLVSRVTPLPPRQPLLPSRLGEALGGKSLKPANSSGRR
jgi:hypothetical protein